MNFNYKLDGGLISIKLQSFVSKLQNTKFLYHFLFEK